MASEQQVLKTPHIIIVHNVCWHPDLNATPVDYGKPELVKYNPEVEGTTPEKYFDKYDPRSDKACGRCRHKIKPLMDNLKKAHKWVGKLEPPTNGSVVANAFSDAQKSLEKEFTRFAKDQVQEQEDPKHKLPLIGCTRQLRQLGLFAEEMERNVTCHYKPKIALVGKTISVLAERFLAKDAWEDVSDNKLRDVFEKSMGDLMKVVLQMSVGTTSWLEDDIEATMKTEFAKHGL
ncbi:uncharacterized protein PG998_013243 [Apiospora kogelbergensis]|uniref:uncharacterized protein n=1 Tax=Apiospora kogelbergensis TaxID=1337665 RepID=UPI0031306FEA